jgi:site-specific recombinase XerD
MATVYISKRKTRKGQSYSVKYYDPLTRKKKHYKTFHKLREAQQAANALRAGLDSGSTPETQKNRLVPLTFGEVADSLRAEWAQRLRVNDLARKTHDEYGYRLNVLERQFGKQLLCQISTQEIKKYLNDVAEAFTNVTSNRALDGTPIKSFNRSWWAARREAGIKDFHFHDLRHTFCSNLIISGSGLKDAKEMIGHSDISMTDRYSHLTALHKRSRQQRLVEHYENHK